MVAVITADVLYANRGKYLVVDVRSELAYSTLRIKGATHMTVSAAFVDSMRRVAMGQPDKTLIFYCDGNPCLKSYLAAQACRDQGIDNVAVYDEGILHWSRKYPHEAELFGKAPIEPSKLIGRERIRSYIVPAERFEAMLAQENVLILGIRERTLHETPGLFPGIETVVYFDERDSLDRHIDKAKKENKTILIYDADGNQIEWVMYYLEAKQAKQFYFLEGGVQGYYQRLRKQFSL